MTVLRQGSPPQRREDDVTTCIGYDANSGNACAGTAVDEVIAACVHEHIGPRRLCQYHIADLAHGLMVCGDCKDCASPHRCELVAVPIRDRT